MRCNGHKGPHTTIFADVRTHKYKSSWGAHALLEIAVTKRNKPTKDNLYIPNINTTMASSKIVMVTGANTGIGYEIVKALLESVKPYHVFVGSRSLDKGKIAIEELQKAFPKSSSTMEAIQLDLTSDESIESSFDQVKKSFDHLDVLVNNAGQHRASGPSSGLSSNIL